MGIFSMIDVLVNRPKSEVLDQLPIAEDIKSALLSDGQGEGKLSHLYSLIKAYEMGHWDVLPQRAERLRIAMDSIADLYMESIEWANGFM
jgi:EAL and modified HD-GYP domain-containing signal transduction protein